MILSNVLYINPIKALTHLQYWKSKIILLLSSLLIVDKGGMLCHDDRKS